MQEKVSYSIENPKIDPARKKLPDGSPDDNDRADIGPTKIAFQEWEDANITPPNLEEMRKYRLDRIRAELKTRAIPAILLTNPMNIRYAIDAPSLQIWTMRNMARALFIPVEGKVILFDYQNTEFLTEHLHLVDEVRTMIGFYFFAAGKLYAEKANEFSQEIKQLLQKVDEKNLNLAIDRMEICGINALKKCGINIKHGQLVMEMARLVKDKNEIQAMHCGMKSCQIAINEMRKKMKPEISENDMWSILHAENIRRGGEWIETRTMASGPRTNPWFHECGHRIIKEGDIVAFDTDLVGPYGYCIDISRTWICGERKPTPEQRKLYRIAYDHIQENMEMLKPGVSFYDLTYKGHQLPQEYRKLQYVVKYHGVGLCDEYPAILYPEEISEGAYFDDAVLLEGMALTVEAYVGEVGGREGVKLEEQVLITKNGFQIFGDCPYEKEMLV